MTTLIFLIVIFLILLIGPIMLAVFFFKKYKGSILHINQDRVRDERYFAKSFSGMMEKQLAEADGDTIFLSKPEKILRADGVTDIPDCVENLTVAEHGDLQISGNVKEFRREIYCAGNAEFINRGMKLRAAFSKKKIILGEEIEVVRWIDAEETLAVYDHCDLGISATAGQAMCIGADCSFHRLYAPEIRIGQKPDAALDPLDGREARIFRLPISGHRRNKRYISKEMINEDGVVNFSVAAWSNVTVTEKVIIQGDIRSHKGIRVCEGAVVCGNMFAETDIIIEKNATVLGNIFSQGSIRAEEGVMLGQPGRIISLIARNHIYFAGNIFLYGYASCEAGGKTAETGNQVKTEETAAGNGDTAGEAAGPADWKFMEIPKAVEKLVFKDRNDYEHVDMQGFRYSRDLREVIIPEGADAIPDSMFFRCRRLRKAGLPSTLRKIGEYAFADDDALEDIGDFSMTGTEEVGVSAFENCVSLQKINFPESIRILHGAAFAGASALCRITIPEGAKLRRLEDHCFRDCTSLKELYIPDTVDYIGTSAFKGCTALERLYLPDSCRNHDGIIQLLEENPSVKLIFRQSTAAEILDGERENLQPESGSHQETAHVETEV